MRKFARKVIGSVIMVIAFLVFAVLIDLALGGGPGTGPVKQSLIPTLISAGAAYWIGKVSSRAMFNRRIDNDREN